MDDVEPEVKVTDRRHFTADGQLRSQEPEASPQSAPEGSGDAKPTAEAQGPARDPSEAEEAGRDDEPEAGPVTFSSFILSLATQAASLLGGEGKNLAAARQVISALEMLKDKTEGCRTEEESKMIDLVLFDLRMAFVGAARGSGR